MNPARIFPAISFTAVCLFGPAAAAVKLDLPAEWLIKTGDDASWASPALDDSGWSSIKIDAPWERNGLPDYDGYAWYRLHLTVPGEWRDDEQVREAGGLLLELGPIDDVDETYLNGVLVGRTGALPPEYETAWDVSRTYKLPAHLVNWGGENLIAVRVFDGQGEGGMYGGSAMIRSLELLDEVEISLSPSRKDGIYAGGKPLSAKLKILNRGSHVVPGTLKFSWRSDLVREKKSLEEGEIPLELASGEFVSRKFKYLPPAPGFYRLSVELKAPQSSARSDFLVLGSDVFKLKSPLTRPDDLDEFWAARLVDLGKVAPEYRIEPKPEMSTDKVDVSLVEMKSYGGIRIYGWYTVPKKKGPHAAVLSLPGYTSVMTPAAWRENVAVLGLDIRAHGLSQKDMNPKGQELMFMGLTGDPKDYFYTGVYLDCIRGLDFLCSRPEVDATRVGVEGGSQGGGLSLATAVLDDRVKACAPDVPWAHNWRVEYETSPWWDENLPPFLAKRPDLTLDGLFAILSYCDPMNMAERIKCPVNLSLGLRDEVCPPRMILGTYNRLESPKEIHFYPFGGHDGGGREHELLKLKWMARRLKVRK